MSCIILCNSNTWYHINSHSSLLFKKIKEVENKIKIKIREKEKSNQEK